MGRVRAYIGLGANVGDASATLAAAVHALADLPGARVRGVSRLYATAPVGVPDQPEFRNAVVALDVPTGSSSSPRATGPSRATGSSRASGPSRRAPEAGALDLLVALKDIERTFGRRVRERWGPREVDLDLLVYGRQRIRVPRPAAGRSTDPAKASLPLTVPHPEARRRLFVLAPLEDLSPGLVPPGWSETVASAAARQREVEGPNAVRAIAAWDGSGWRPLG